MNVPLTTEGAKVVNERIERGEFQNPAEVVDEALRALQERDDRRERERIEALIDEAADSEGSEMTPQDWQKIRREASAPAVHTGRGERQ
jgi:putative addiction module CopG family antidote